MMRWTILILFSVSMLAQPGSDPGEEDDDFEDLGAPVVVTPVTKEAVETWREGVLAAAQTPVVVAAVATPAPALQETTRVQAVRRWFVDNPEAHYIGALILVGLVLAKKR